MEKQLINEVERQRGVVKWISKGKGEIAPPEGITTDEWTRKLCETFGTQDGDAMRRFVNQLVSIIDPRCDNPAEALNQITPLLYAIKPADELEGMLALQMIGVHAMSMEVMRRAMKKDQSVTNVNNVNHAVKLTRTFISQLDALNKHRGKGQQKMIVEHVQINNGGQAVIGNVNRGGEKNEK